MNNFNTNLRPNQEIELCRPDLSHLFFVGDSPPPDELSIILSNILADLEEATRTIESLNRRLATWKAAPCE